VITVPEVEKGRYHSGQFIDLYTHNFADVGTRTTGNGTGSFLLAGPDWKGEKPAGIKDVIRCETRFALVLFRTQLFGPDDIENVKKVQAGYKVQTLSTFLGQPAPAAPPAIDFMKPLGTEQERTSLDFFDELNFVLHFCPTHPSEVDLMARFAKVNIGAGKKFAAATLSPELRKAIEDGRADAWKAHAELKKRKRTVDLAITHKSALQFEAEVNVGEAGEPAPDHHVAGWRILRPCQVASQLRDLDKVAGDCPPHHRGIG